MDDSPHYDIDLKVPPRPHGYAFVEFEDREMAMILMGINWRVELAHVEGKQCVKVYTMLWFSNLQNVVRKIKTGKCDYHFLEIMACPSGCLNGGGQIKPKPRATGKDPDSVLETAYMEKENVIPIQYISI
uniref:Iron hydrogenase large subunit C-terminal domain-containing protein n=1 Tax=Cannabis sativa TaxID=3483 RepID=A0A803NZS1_CANSA